MTLAIQLALALLAVPAVFTALYLLIMTVLSARLRPPLASSRRLRFDVIVPAHDEEQMIARTVANLRALDWPASGFRIIVVADNCTDATARIARESQALVLERLDPLRRGKGYALDFAFRESRAAGSADAVVVVDADAEVSTNLLEAFAARIEYGSDAVQAHYGVLNPLASWRTRLIAIAKGAFHIVRSRARERLGLSCGIRGNGWCVTHRLLDKVPYQAFSLTEDLEFGLDIGMAGFRVAYADEASANAEMVSGEQVARRQRQRWETGRLQLIRTRTPSLLVAAIRGRSKVCLDLALDLLVLPLSYVALNIFLLVVAAALATLRFPQLLPWLGCGIVCAMILLAYVLRGWQVSGVGSRGLLDLLRAPGFVLWKLLLMSQRKRPANWTRTERERPLPPGS